MDQFNLVFKYERKEDRSRGVKTNIELARLLKNAQYLGRERVVDVPPLKAVLSGVGGMEETLYEFENEGTVKVSELDALDLYGKTVFLEGFNQENQTYQGLITGLKKLGFELYQGPSEEEATEECLTNLGIPKEEQAGVIKALESITKQKF